MKPRVFVSSTYYDLKYVRESIELFITQYGFDAVLFESGRVTFEHGKPLDISCYNEVEICHLMVLIVGGRYGSISSSEGVKEKQKRYDNEYVSITRKEFETAKSKNIPTFVFIDRNVYAEYQTYKTNENFFTNSQEIIKEGAFKFAYVDSINIFKFIDSLLFTAVKPFDKVDEIIEYLRSQLAGMFYLYLDQIKRESTNKEILSSVNQLNSTATKIDTLVDAIARKVIDEQQFKDLDIKQFNSVSEIFSEQLDKYIDFTVTQGSLTQEHYEKIADILIKHVFNQDISIETAKQMASAHAILQKELPEAVSKIISKEIPNIKVNNLQFFVLYRQYKRNILPFIDSTKKREIFKEKLTDNLISIALPF